MNPSLHPPSAPGKKIAAFVCLLAVVLLWAPLWAAALQANGMVCCTGGMCPTHAHSNTNHASAENETTSETPMQCDHSGHGSMMNCDMSCCHDQGQTFVASLHFVMPTLPVVLLPQQTLASAPTLEVTQISHPSAPLPPPPRIPSI